MNHTWHYCVLTANTSIQQAVKAETMTTGISTYLKVLVISLVTVAIWRSGVSLAATLPVATIQNSIEQGLRTPTRLALGGDGSLYVADPANRGVLKFGPTGTLLKKFVVDGIPQGIAVTSAGRLLVSQKEFVSLYDSNGTELRKLGSGIGQFVSAADIALDDTGRIYVTDSKGRCVQLFDAAGVYLSRFGVNGSGDGQFLYPTAIAYEKLSQQIAVADSLNARVQFYDKTGVFIRSIGGSGTGPLKFMHPQGLAFEYGSGNSVRMYVADAMLKNIQAIDPAGAGKFLSYVKAGKGTEHGSPSDIAFDQASRRLYVVNGLGGITVYKISDGSVVVESVTPAAQANATVIASTARAVAASVASATTTSVSPLTLSTVADGSVVTQELLDVTGLVAGIASVTVNGSPVAVANGLFSTAVALQNGANEIKVTVTDNSGRSWSDLRSVTRSSGTPMMTLTVPDILATDSAVLALKGSVEKGVYLSVAGVPAEISSQEWNASISLTPGLNTIELQAIELSGRLSSQKRTILYNPAAPALAITVPAEDLITTLKNTQITGTVSAATGVTVTATLNGIPRKVTVDGDSYTFPVEFSEEGVYTVTVFAAAAGRDVSTVSRTLFYRMK